MSSIASNPTSDPPAVDLKPRRGYSATILRDTIRRPGAMLGLIWIGFVAFLAVFAPVLASSDPYLVKTKDGQVSSPWLRYLTPADITLLLMVPISAAAFFVKRFSMPRRVLALFIIACVIMVGFSLRTPVLRTTYDQYRQMEKQGELEWAWRAPIPFSPSDRLRDQTDVRALPPGPVHWMGTEGFSSDVASLLIHACRIALTIGFISTGIAVVIGVLVGGFTGYFAGQVDLLGMRIVEIFEAIPQLYLLLTFVAFFPDNPVIFGVTIPRIYMLMAIIGFTSWTGYARYIRAEFFKLRKQDYVHAAVACGLPLRSVLFKHMLPNAIAPVLVSTSFGVAYAILTESTLSFLGIGLIDEPSWGGLLKQALGETGKFSWWIATFPGLAMLLTVFSYNLIGEALRDAIDPHTQRLNRTGS
jgi:peptide/nickel transport system permease protein